jgi:(p)ppGpp synthase/HD superfamily hydrolase
MNKKADFDMQKYMSVVEWMKLKHGKQLRAFTYAPYWTHPIRVASLVMKYKKSHKIDELVITALLHDVVEDTDTSILSIRYQFGDLVGNLVEELTSDKKEMKKQGKTEYLIEKMVGMSSWAMCIKCCDRLDNISDFIFAPITFIEKYGKETQDIIRAIKLRYPLTETHLQILSQIDKTLNSFGVSL